MNGYASRERSVFMRVDRLMNLEIEVTTSTLDGFLSVQPHIVCCRIDSVSTVFSHMVSRLREGSFF